MGNVSEREEVGKLTKWCEVLFVRGGGPLGPSAEEEHQPDDLDLLGMEAEQKVRYERRN